MVFMSEKTIYLLIVMVSMWELFINHLLINVPKHVMEKEKKEKVNVGEVVEGEAEVEIMGMKEILINLQNITINSFRIRKNKKKRDKNR